MCCKLITKTFILPKWCKISFYDYIDEAFTREPIANIPELFKVNLRVKTVGDLVKGIDVQKKCINL